MMNRIVAVRLTDNGWSTSFPRDLSGYNRTDDTKAEAIEYARQVVDMEGVRLVVALAPDCRTRGARAERGV